MDIREILRQFILDQYLKGELPHTLGYDTPLLSSGIIDSIGVLALINFVEDRFSIEFQPRELDRDRLESIARIHQAIVQKLEGDGTDRSRMRL